MNMFIDHPASDLRVWLWFTFKHNNTGILIWETNYWCVDCTGYDKLTDPYTEVMSWSYVTGKTWGNGEGRFFYPPEGWNKDFDKPIFSDPIESMRWEYLREGIEDWEYLTMLKELYESSALNSEQKKIAKTLLDIPSSIVGDTDTEYSITPEEMVDRRNKVGKFITCFYNGEEYREDSSETDSASNRYLFSVFYLLCFILLSFMF